MSIYPKIFARFYDGFMHSFEKKLHSDRQMYLHDLRGNIIDVGSGTGVNFNHYHSSAKVLAIEPAIEMLKKSEGKIGNKNIHLINQSITDAFVDEMIAPESIDAIVCTLVLCTIPKPEKALELFKKWLKPDGKLIVIEHIHSANKWTGKFQNFVNPFWKKFGEGCNLNRHTDELIQQYGFYSENMVYFNVGLRIVKGVYHQNQ